MQIAFFLVLQYREFFEGILSVAT